MKIVAAKAARLSYFQHRDCHNEPHAAMRRVLDLIETCKAEGDPQEIFAAIEEDLRGRLAVPVDSK